MRKLALMAAAAAVMGAGPVMASPSVTFPATVYAEQIGPQSNLGAGSVEFAGDTATADFAGTPEVQVHGSSSTWEADASASWQFVIEGAPFTNVAVPIVISGGYSLDSTGGGDVVANVLEGEHNSALTNLFHVGCNGGSGDCNTGTFTLHTNVFSNVFQDLGIQTAGIVVGGSGHFDGFIDPMISFDLDSGFDFSGLQLLVAPDAQPGPSGAPEPAAWALIILGFGAAGAALRRRGTPAAA